MKIIIHESNTKLHVVKICLQLDLHNVNCDLNLHTQDIIQNNRINHTPMKLPV